MRQAKSRLWQFKRCKGRRDAVEGVASLHRICERAVAAQCVEPRTVCDVLDWADAADAALLRHHCLVRRRCRRAGASSH